MPRSEFDPAARPLPAPRPRADLEFHPRPGVDPHVVVGDPVRGKYYRIGAAEYLLLRQFDGRRTLDQCVHEARQRDPQFDLTRDEAAELAQWLVLAQLAHPPLPIPSSQWVRWSQSEAQLARQQAVNPLFLRVPLCRPDRWLGMIAPWFNWVFTAPVVCLVLAAAAYVLLPLVGRWREIVGDLEDLFSPDRQLAMLAAWLGLKILHELGHGLACKRYGGHVREAGVTFIVAAPAAYIDVTSSWRFPSTWSRVSTSLAGMYVELIVGIAAALAWQYTQSPTVRQVAADLILMCTVTTVVFNLNPLSRFDGYYVLADLLGVHNLYDMGRQYVAYVCKRHLLGVPTPAPHIPRWSTLVKVYGIAATVWRWMITLGLVTAAAVLFQGAGVVLAMLGVVTWYGVPALRIARYLFAGAGGESPRRVRSLAVIVAGGAAAWLILSSIPASWSRTAPAIVEYDPPTVVRAHAPGFIERLHVVDGESVETGQVLCKLRNDELKLELARVKSALVQAELRATALRQRLPEAPQDIDRYHQAISEAQAATARIRELESKLADLTIRAPHGGRVIRRRLDTLAGTYLHAGEELLSLGHEDAKRLRVSLDQTDIDDGAAERQLQVKVYAPECDPWTAHVTRLDPRATLEPPHLSLCVPFGGPLAVHREGDQWRLVAPRLSGYVPLDGSQATLLRAGQRTWVSWGPSTESLGTWAWRWLQTQAQQVLGAGG